MFSLGKNFNHTTFECKKNNLIVKMNPNTFFDLYKDWAIETQAKSGVPASITLAQAALESGYGESTLAKTANNFFGIKVSSGWFGDYVLANDDKPNEKFRKYKTVYDSFIDHADFLVDNSRYNSLFENTNYVDWANGLSEAGYASDPNYASKLIGIIQQYGLERYDREGDEQMKGLTNTIIRNRKRIYTITIIIAVLLIALWFVGKKVFKK